jgi:probable HAF family extracellular repeat protein
MARGGRLPRERKQGQTHHRRLALESLEDRLLLATYTITELGTSGGRQGRAYGINDSGITVGESQPQGIRFFHASSWTTGGVKTDHGVLGNNKFSVAEAINNVDQIAGSSNFGASPTAFHAVRISGGVMTDLGSITGSSYGKGINSSNTIAGYSEYGGPAGTYHAVEWTSSNTLIDRHPNFGGNTSQAYDINNSGVIVGSGNGSSFTQYPHPFRYNGSFTDLGLMPAWAPLFNQVVGGEAFGINGTGEIVGGNFYVGGFNQTKIWHAFKWTQSGGYTDLGNLGQGGDWSQAFDINDSGHVVGWANTTFGDSPKHAWVWTGSGAIQDLNNMLVGGDGWVLTSANEINNNGQIVGYGTFQGKPRGFLLTPVPSPVPPASNGFDAATLDALVGRGSRSLAIQNQPVAFVSDIAATRVDAIATEAAATSATQPSAPRVITVTAQPATVLQSTLDQDPLG